MWVLALAMVSAADFQFSIIDWNINKGHKLERLAEVLERQRPELCLLQEVDRNAKRTGKRDIAETLGKRLNYHVAFGEAFQELGQGSHDDPAYMGQATLSSLPIRSARVLRFQRQTGFWKPRPFVPNWGPLQRRLGGRVALITELDAAGYRVVVYNLHLESRGFGGARLGQLEEAIADSRQYSGDVAVVIAGDLNTKYFPSLFTSRLERAGYRNCFNGKVRTHRLIGSLDWIFVRGPVACEQPEVIRGLKASDHDALKVRLSMRESSPRNATRGDP